MSSDTLAQEISTRFADIASDAQLIAECVAVCQNYSLTAEELQYKWEAHNFRATVTRSEISPYTLESLNTLKTQIQRDRAAKKPPPPRTSIATIDQVRCRNRNPAARAPVQVKLEPNVDGFGMGMEGIAGPSTVKRAYRYMHEKPSGNASSDDIIDEFAERIREHYDLADLGDPSRSTTDDITVVGRIIQDDDAVEEVKLADGAISLECSRALGNGERVPLPLRGKNGGGGYFQVAEILTMPPLLPSAPSVKADTDASAFLCLSRVDRTPPTRTSDSRPWRALIKKIQEAKPAVVLLVWDLSIDALHPLIKSGDVDSTPLNLFRTRFADPLRTYLNSVPGSIALIVPSVRDLVGDHAVFPQSELPVDVARGDPRIHLLPNPAWFTLNDITFAATSADVLFHIKKGEFVKRGEEVDATPPMSPEDTGRSFYPVFPVPLELASEVVLDSGDAPECAPDVIIVPSRLRQFAKTVYATAALNPSFVSKGSYVVLDVAARDGSGAKARLSPRVVKLE
ncbi:hypothetical protein B0H14DRAFT_2750502 [Mycena olivaceomarginata]|nr:hypothetical protein B0H14DRAFT_2750502 [Mycena olivaceomarginata]